MTALYRLIDPDKRGWKDDEYIDQLRNSGVLIPVTIDYVAAARAHWDANPFGEPGDLVVENATGVVDAGIGDAT